MDRRPLQPGQRDQLRTITLLVPAPERGVGGPDVDAPHGEADSSASILSNRGPKKWKVAGLDCCISGPRQELERAHSRQLVLGRARVAQLCSAGVRSVHVI